MKLFKTIVAVAASCLMLTSCESEGGLTALRKRIDALENISIATLTEQVNSIKSSMGSIQETENILLSYIKTLQDDVKNLGDGITPETAGLESRIKDLEDLAKSFSADIKKLQEYADGGAALKTWANGTFATLEQYKTVQGDLSSLKTTVESISKTIGGFDEKLTTLETNLNSAISKSEEAMKKWVNEKLSGYYTIAEIDAKLSALNTGTYDPGAAVSGTDEEARAQIKELKEELEKAKTDIEKAYNDAIAKAIEANSGVISTEIAKQLAEALEDFDSTINGIKEDITSIQGRLDEAEASIKQLLSRVETVTVIPEYEDGSVGISKGEKDIVFEIYPLSVADALSKLGPSALQFKAVYTKTKAAEAGSSAILPVSACKYSYGTFTITVSGENLDELFFEGELPASARLRMMIGGVSAVSSYFRLTPEE